MLPIRLRGARTHNLKGVDLDVAAGALVAVTGVSGAGKSSLAIDTLYSEGQRRFVESFSPYARQFLERLERPPMDALDPVAAGVAVDRRAPVKSSRSTVATMADIEPYVSALYAREALPVCPDCGALAITIDAAGASARATEAHDGAQALVTYRAPAADPERFLTLREGLIRDGYRRLLVGGEVRDLDGIKPSEVVASGHVDVVIDRVKVSARNRSRLGAAIEQAWQRSGGDARVHVEGSAPLPITRGLSCPSCGRSFAPPKAGLFSYQSPTGACPSCRGFGRTIGLDMAKVIPDERRTLKGGVIRPWNGSSSEWERKSLLAFCDRKGIPVNAPWSALTDAQRRMVIEGEGSWSGGKYPGVRAWFTWLEGRTYKMHVRVLLARYRSYDLCAACHGKRLSPESLTYRVGGLDIAAFHALELREAHQRLSDLRTTTGQGEIARRELAQRLAYLTRVGLGYLTLDRQARTLSGGEAQRVALTAALGTSLTGALFVLDEPTVGLHPSDVPPLVTAMRELSEAGNAVLVVEHEPLVIDACDRVIELGPGAGAAGGSIVYDGPARQRPSAPHVATGAKPPPRRTPMGHVSIEGARANNLRNVTVDVPLGVVVAVTGPSGSGKSTLVEDILYRGIARARGVRDVEAPGAYGALRGATSIVNPVLVDQTPLGRTSRGNPATYTGAWSRIRDLLGKSPDALARDITPAHFSFNVALGRCEACNGEGSETIEMQFLADVSLTCPVCRGQRFNSEVLEVRYQGKNASDLLAMSVDEALSFFAKEATIVRALGPLRELGLGYLALGQPLSTLSGGEAQRLKIAQALTDHTGTGSLVVLDEPSAGLHPSEVAKLTAALSSLVKAGASVIVVDHDLDVITAADWVIDLGPGAGAEGGLVVAQGTPEDVMKAETKTGEALRAHGVLAKAPLLAASKSGGAPAPAYHHISVKNAREHNLKEVSAEVPHDALVVVTGPSGSGKSTFAFDVVFAEGQRRFLETLTPYARQFLPTLPRPDVDRVTGVPPSIALEQRTTRSGSSSTVSTVTEIAHYLRLLFAKVGDPHCPACDTPITARPPDQLFTDLVAMKGSRTLLAPAVVARKGTYLDVFTNAARAGITRAVADGVEVNTDQPPRLKKTMEHSIDLVIFEGKLKDLDRRLFDRALAFGKGAVKVKAPNGDEQLLSTSRTCPRCGTGVPELDPRWFSFNTKQGKCEDCEGAGVEGGPEALSGDTAPDPCPSCGGSRLSPLPRSVRLLGDRYHEVSMRSITDATRWARALSFSGDRARIAEAPLKELRRRLEFVLEVGLGYLSLDRRAATLSGGEMQRLRLAAQLGSGLTGALYVLDEPTIGLHPRDTERLLSNLRRLVSMGSTVLMVEHDADTIRAADYLIDLGPSGGRGGGHIVAAGPAGEVLAHPDSPTGHALSKEGELLAARKALGPSKEHIELKGARAHNLKGDLCRIPVGRLTVIAGVSGSGKSTLVRHVLYPAARKARALTAPEPGPHDSIALPKSITRVMAVDQSPIGRTPRSVPATFLGVWDEVRRLYAASPEAQVRGYSAARFSFNTGAGGRCSGCDGQGVKSHEMSFLPDVTTVCEACGGARFEPATLEVRYLGKTIGEMLDLSAEEAAEVLATHTKIAEPLATMRDLGVGYLHIGQGSHTLSGGEAQRLKLAAECSTRSKPTLYVLDEPTTGLHLTDVKKLIVVLDRLVTQGHTLVVVEHHPDVIASADHVIELGPEGGAEGGRIVAEGPPSAVAKAKTATGKVLRELFARAKASN